MSETVFDFQDQWVCPCGCRDFITDVMRPGLLCTNCGLETLPEVLDAMAKDRDAAKLKVAMDATMERLTNPPLVETSHEQGVAKLLEIIAEAKSPKLDPMGENMSTELKRREEILTRAKLAGTLQLDQPSDTFGSMAEGAGVAWDVCGEQPERQQLAYASGDPFHDNEAMTDHPLPANVPPEPAGEFSEGMHTHLPTDAQTRKDCPVVTGLLDYFPLACAYVGHVSKVGNDQHNPGQPMRWVREKSTDHADCVGRHLSERGGRDKDGLRHTGKVAWRALALLQTELENDPEW